MNSAHWHLMLNHFPVTGLLLGLLLWGLAFKVKRHELDRLLRIWFLVMGILIIPVYVTGLNSHDILHDLPGISHEQIETHEDWGRYTLFAMLALSFLSVMSLIRPMPIIHRILPILVLVAFALAFYTSHLGGFIRHPEIQPGFVVPSGEMHHQHLEIPEAHTHQHPPDTEHHHEGG